jgi:hypothetical protein
MMMWSKKMFMEDLAYVYEKPLAFIVCGECGYNIWYYICVLVFIFFLEFFVT